MLDLDANGFGVLLGAAGAAVGLPLGAYFKYLLDRRNASAKVDVDVRQQAHEQLIRLVGKLEARIDHLEKAHGDCQRENASLREEVGRLREAVERLTRDLKEYEQPTKEG